MMRDINDMTKYSDNMASTSWSTISEFANSVHPDAVSELDQCMYWSERERESERELIHL